MKNLYQFFERMNNTDFPYIVMRNFENLPDSAQEGDHGDIDLLVYDIKHWQELYPEATRVFPSPRVMFSLSIGGLLHYVDVRYIGDGYYPRHLEISMIDTREYNERGFYTPNPVHFRIGLIYHVAHHKNFNNYKKHIGDSTVEEMLEALKSSKIGYVTPEDTSVGRFNQYWKGATSVVTSENGEIKKQQTGFSEFDLIDNEERILKSLDSIHFPKVLGKEDGVLSIEDCGERLTVENTPDNWKDQLAEIINHLQDHNVQHRDIKPDNLMVKDRIIKLIDFGWARVASDAPDTPPDCLGYPYKPSWGHDDSFSMRKIIKEMKFKMEERACVSLK